MTDSELTALLTQLGTAHAELTALLAGREGESPGAPIRPTPRCVPLPRIAAGVARCDLTDDEKGHIRGCAFCSRAFEKCSGVKTPDPAGPSPRLEPGARIPHKEGWVLTELLGRGSCGEVWMARESGTNAVCAVKIYTHPAARDALVKWDADGSRAALVALRDSADADPRVLAPLEYDLTADTPWLMYEFVPGGRSFADAVEESRPLPPADRVARALALVQQLAEALARCHARGVVHRDVKPSNVLMHGEVPRLIDFGVGSTSVAAAAVTRLTATAPSAYTLRYASPEQVPDAAPDPRDDVFALGVLAYQILTGRTEGGPTGDWPARLGADVPGELVELIGVSTSDDRAERPRNASEWERVLRAVRSELAAPLRHADRSGRRRRTVLIDPPALPTDRVWAVPAGPGDVRHGGESAREVRPWFLPQTLPEVPGYEFYSHYSPAQMVGGDYYDFVALPGGRVAVVLGNVAGKGVPAALLAKLSAEVRFCLLTVPNLARAVGLLNEQMIQDGLDGRFVTLVVAVLDPVAHSVTLVNAGRDSPQLYRASAGPVDAISLEATGGPLGVLPGYPFEQVSFTLEGGDWVAMFTDGDNCATVGPEAIAPEDKSLAPPSRKTPEGARRPGERLLAAILARGDCSTAILFGRLPSPASDATGASAPPVSE